MITGLHRRGGLGTLTQSQLDAFAQAIATKEGYYSSGTLAQINNNPGNLRSWGSYPVVNGFAQFPDPATGWAALNSQIQLNISRGLDLYQFFGGLPGVYGGYAPAADSNNPTAYAQYVAAQTGIDPNVPLNSVDGGAVYAADGGPTGDYFPPDTSEVDSGVLAGLGISSTTALLIGGAVIGALVLARS